MIGIPTIAPNPVNVKITPTIIVHNDIAFLIGLNINKNNKIDKNPIKNSIFNLLLNLILQIKIKESRD